MRKIAILSIFVLFLCGSALGDWDPTDPYKMHLPQPPDLSVTGMDVRAGQYGLTDPPVITPTKIVLADDFRCTRTGPITDIHIWGSWKGDLLPSDELDPASGTPLNPDPGLVAFTLGIWSDIPVDANGNPFSKPGQLLWTGIFQPGDFSVRSAGTGPEDWYEPGDQVRDNDNHLEAYQYNFLIDEPQAFVQQGTPNAPIVYWLSVDARPLGAPVPLQTNGIGPAFVEAVPPVFGWKTTYPPNNWNDDATYSFWMMTGGNPDGFDGWTKEEDWLDMHFPDDHEFAGTSINMAFVITPEPTTMMLLGAGAIALIRRRK